MGSETATTLPDFPFTHSVSSNSYGTFFPRYSASEEGETAGNLEFSGGFSYPPSTCTLNRKVSCESGFESYYTRKNSLQKSPPLSPLNLSYSRNTSQESALFEEIEKSLSEAESDLMNIEEMTSTEDKEFLEEKMYITSAVVTINSINADYELVEIDDDFVNDTDEQKLYKSTFGVLYRIRRMVELSCTKLDSLVGMDFPGFKTDAWIAERRQHYKGRLDNCRDRVDKQMEKMRNKNEIIINGTRHNWKLSENPVLAKIRETRVSCGTLMHVLLFFSMTMVVSFMFMWNLSRSTQWVVYLRLLRSPLIIVLLLYLYGINMKVWARYGIDYLAVFNHNPAASPTPTYIFGVAGFLTCVFSLLLVVLIVTSAFFVKLPIKIIPLLMWLVLAAFLLNPFKCYSQKLRFRFVTIFGHILLAPLVFVYFSDFFLADQFNSTVAVFLDMQYTICYFFSDSWSGEVNDGTCTSSGNGIRPFISFLPALWRMLQCFRCYYNTYNAKHLLNAGKYFTTFPVIVLATLYATKVKTDFFESFLEEGTTWIVIFWIVFALVHAVYTFIWDVCCDWGLWDIVKCKGFHRCLLYKRKMYYVLAITVDFVLRFMWTLKLTLAIAWQKDSDLIYTGLVLAEIIRRFIWNFFRVEFAHVS